MNPLQYMSNASIYCPRKACSFGKAQIVVCEIATFTYTVDVIATAYVL